ncbi:hypothetical protein F5884DRAFT_716720 [Xylogone sp. PMI_703]|nr:hypothetical protein F5884DRAFT_716720 [Xylogone sp. PMI_703]
MSCDACIKRFLGIIVGSPINSPTLRAARQVRRNFRRRYTVPTTVIAHGSERRNASTAHYEYKESTDSTLGRPSNELEEGKQWLESKDISSTSKQGLATTLTDGAIKRTLKYLRDPLKLADFVREKLRADQFNEAQAIVRAASKEIQCTVSWNHLIDYLLSKGRMNSAIKTYHEMKKRAQQPDSHTYTIIFRGCAVHPNSAQALAKAMSIYHSMFAQNSAVKPNTIHMNAMLKMCAKAQDMDALFGVAAQMPEIGLRAPNNLSYTTIFNALRLHTINDQRSDLTPSQKELNCRKVILDSRRMWSDITKLWHKGEIWIDEELVCAMGRILLMGDRRDWDDIFSLLEQTMNIPRQFPRQEHAMPPGVETASQMQKSLSGDVLPYPPETVNELAAVQEDHSSISIDEFSSSNLPKSQSNTSVAYAKPGQNTISLAIDALLKLRFKSYADQYWDIFINQYKIKSDAENFHAYLRILRISRASSQAVEILEKMDLDEMKPKTFRIAMSTCERDKNNPNAFANAGKILDFMERALEVPDINTLIAYLRVAISAATKAEKSTPQGQLDLTKYAQGTQILRAVQRVNPFFVNLKSYASFGDPAKLGSRLPIANAEFVDSFQQLIRKIISSIDLLMNKGLVQQNLHKGLDTERRKLTAFVTRFNHTNRQLGTLPKKSRNYLIKKVQPDLVFKGE